MLLTFVFLPAQYSDAYRGVPQGLQMEGRMTGLVECAATPPFRNMQWNNIYFTCCNITNNGLES